MINNQPLRAAVIGVGYLGRFHAQKYQKIAGVQLVAVVDANPERARQVGEELGVPWFTDHRELIDRVDIVSIAASTMHHFALARACLNAHWAVLLEKPMTVTLEEADELIALADQNKVILQVGHIKRFHPGVIALCTSGLLMPTPRYIRTQRLAPFKPRATDVDVVLDLMIHDIDLVAMLARSSVVSMEAFGATVLTKQTDFATARIRFSNGCIADLTASRVAQQGVRDLLIFQDATYISLDFPTKIVQLKQRGQGQSTEWILPIAEQDALEAEIYSFCGAVRGEHPPVVSGAMGREALAIALQIQQVIRDKPDDTV